VAPVPQDLSEQLLRTTAIAVDVRGVDEVHAGLERGVDDGSSFLQADPPAEVVAAQTHDRDHEPGRADRSISHLRHVLLLPSNGARQRVRRIPRATSGAPTRTATAPIHAQNGCPVMNEPFSVPTPWKIQTTPVTTSAIPRMSSAIFIE